ncbi:hypothetical protein ACOSQ4_031235 [Xanthoceras sorbifolium]
MSFNLKLTLLGIFADLSPSALALLEPEMSQTASALPFTFIPGSSSAENLKIPAIFRVERRWIGEDNTFHTQILQSRWWRVHAF